MIFFGGGCTVVSKATQHLDFASVKWSRHVAALSHLKRFPFTWIRVVDLLLDLLLAGDRELLTLADQLLFELLLALRLQKFLPEGNVGEHRGEGSGEFNGRLGAFLKGMKRRLKL